MSIEWNSSCGETGHSSEHPAERQSKDRRMRATILSRSFPKRPFLSCTRRTSLFLRVALPMFLRSVIAALKGCTPSRSAVYLFALVLFLPSNTDAEAQITPVCERTEEVRDAIVAAVSGVSACANVTDAHLAAITSRLDIGYQGITSLQAGDFDGLTALTDLSLQSNYSLSDLPVGVFDGLTALTDLRLNNNPGTDDFVATANAGGDQRVAQGAAVTLDGSASGGAWGTNVTYQWTKTSGATVTLSGADTDSASFTAPSSDGDLVFTLTVTGKGGSSYTDTDTATVRVGAASTDAMLSGPAGERRRYGSDVRVAAPTSVVPGGFRRPAAGARLREDAP